MQNPVETFRSLASTVAYISELAMKRYFVGISQCQSRLLSFSWLQPLSMFGVKSRKVVPDTSFGAFGTRNCIKTQVSLSCHYTLSHTSR